MKVRQNLAYAYAVAGRWRDARLMVEQDVPADQVGQRMQQWAQLTHAEAYQHRVAGLLNVPAGVRDGGQPIHLALANQPDMQQLASEASASALAAAPQQANADVELPAQRAEELPATPEVGLDTYQAHATLPAVNFAEAFAARDAAPAPLAGVQTDSASFTRAPLADAAAAPAPASVRAPARTPTPSHPAATPRPATRQAIAAASDIQHAAVRTAPAGPVADPTHLVQLGSFSSEQGARRAWGIYVSRHPELADHEMVITQALVRGKRYWRVSAGGFNVATSRSMCSSVNASAAGEGCISWAASSPLPGAVDRGDVMLARR